MLPSSAFRFPRAIILAPDTLEACGKHFPLGPPGLSWAAAESTAQRAAIPANPFLLQMRVLQPRDGHPLPMGTSTRDYDKQ